MSKSKSIVPSRVRTAAPKREPARRTDGSPLNPQLYLDFGAIALVAFGAVVLLGLGREKLVGPLGAWLVMLARLFMGTGVYLAPPLCLLAAWALAGNRRSTRGPVATIGTVGMVLVFLGWMHVLAWGGGDLFATSAARFQWLIGHRNLQARAVAADGGFVGAMVAAVLSPLGIAGSYVALGAGGFSSLLLLTETTIAAVARWIGDRSRRAAALARQRRERLAAETLVVPIPKRRRGLFLDLPGRGGEALVGEEAELELPRPPRRRAAAPPALAAPPAPRRRELPRWLPSLRDVLHWKREVTDPTLLPADLPMAEVAAEGSAFGALAARGSQLAAPNRSCPANHDTHGSPQDVAQSRELRASSRERAEGAPLRASAVREPEPVPLPRQEVRVTRGTEQRFRPPRAGSPEEYTLPPTDLLDAPAVRRVTTSASEAEANISILESTLRDFNIEAQVVEIADGPTVTRYEIRLAPGIRVKKIMDLADNICLSLAAFSVRVEAPIPGKSAIGIEVPKKATRLVTLRECVETREFMDHGSKVAFMLGVDVAGNVCFADLVKMPHLLVAGATNSGKSVCLNVLIASMLFRARPDEVKFILIDPKRVELTLFEGIPHLIHPVVKDVKQAAGLLRWLLREMERRYDLFAEALTRNIDGYNSKVADDPEKRLPYIVLVIDELADLMMLQGAEVETAICRLAQLARATGIHIVIATQRPSVDVITGLIKANVPSRIAFSVTSQIDSRTILDTKGAENLVGKGDMLFKPVDANKPQRLQGAFLREEEVVSLVEYLKTQGRPEYVAEAISVDSLAATRGGGGGGVEEDDEEDELFEPAARFLVTSGHASTSMLQRKFKIGYTRAARLVDMMEAKGIVGPLDGAKPREILMGPARLDGYFHGEREAFFAPLGLGSDGPDPDDGAYSDEE